MDTMIERKPGMNGSIIMPSPEPWYWWDLFFTLFSGTLPLL